MIDPKEDLKNKIQTTILVSWLIGSVVIFVVSSVMYQYIGLEGNSWFQAYGIMVAIVIANYTNRLFRFVEDTEDDIQE